MECVGGKITTTKLSSKVLFAFPESQGSVWWPQDARGHWKPPQDAAHSALTTSRIQTDRTAQSCQGRYSGEQASVSNENRHLLCWRFQLKICCEETYSSFSIKIFHNPSLHMSYGLPSICHTAYCYSSVALCAHQLQRTAPSPAALYGF